MRILYKAFSWIVFSSIVASLLIITLLLIRRAFGKKLNPKLLNGLWIVILVRLLLPITMNNEYSLFNIASNIKNKDSIHEEVEQIKDGLESGKIAENNIYRGHSKRKTLGTPVIKLNKRFIPVIWFGGFLISTAFILTTIYRHKSRLKKMDKVEDEKILSILKKYKKDLTIEEDVRIFTGDEDRGPYIIGIRRPKIFIPKSILEVLNRKELECVILHELSHHKRRDLIVNNVQLLALVLHWFNPFIWVMSKFMREDREMACDDYVMEILGEERSLDYGLTMIDIARKNIGLKNTSLISAYFSLNKEQVKRRIEMISNFKETTLKSKIAMVLSVLIIGGFVLTNGIGIASKVISPSKIEDDVTNRFEIETGHKQFYNLERSKDFMDEDIKIPTKLPEGFDLETIVINNMRDSKLKETRMSFIDEGDNLYSIETSKINKWEEVVGDSISSEGNQIGAGLKNIKIGDIEGVLVDYGVKDAGVQHTFLNEEGHPLTHGKTGFVWKDGNRYYSISAYPCHEEPKEFMFDLESKESKELINSFKNIYNVDQDNYKSKKYEGEFNIYNEKGLLGIEKKLGFDPKIVLKLGNDYEAWDLGVYYGHRLGSKNREDKELTLRTVYANEKSRSNRLIMRQTKESKTYDSIVDGDYEALLKEEFSDDPHKAKIEKLNISDKDVYIARVELERKNAVNITFYNWKDGDHYIQVEIRDVFNVRDGEMEDLDHLKVIEEIIKAK